jgi:uncharacterized SAM-binding protein YcdF (DUF218 family)
VLRRIAALVLLLVVAAWIAAVVGLFVVPHGQHPLRADAVFVLSGSSKRLPVGLRLVREGYAPLLVVDRTRPRASPLERRVCAHQIDVRVLCADVEPYSTVGEAEFLGRLAGARHWTRVDVVTSQFHVLRAKLILRRCYHGRLAVVGAPNELLLLPWNAALESVKLVYHELVHRGC